MRRRFAQYRPTPHRRADIRLFRSVQLNYAGWAAVITLCLAGALTVLSFLLALDRRRHARLTRPAGERSRRRR